MYLFINESDIFNRKYEKYFAIIRYRCLENNLVWETLKNG